MYIVHFWLLWNHLKAYCQPLAILKLLEGCAMPQLPIV